MTYQISITKQLTLQLLAAVIGLFISLSVFAAEQSTQNIINQDDGQKFQRRVELMSTIVEFSILTNDEDAANSAVDKAAEEFERIEAQMSEWRIDSTVSLINQFAGQKSVAVSDELWRLLEQSKELGRLTKGKFDVTFAGVGQLWDFRRAKVPSNSLVDQAISRIDYTNLVLDDVAKTAFLKSPDMKLGLGGIAKGYAVDRAAQIMRSAGFKHFSINAGGDLFVTERGTDNAWRIGIQDPRNRGKLIAILPVTNIAVATSGDYERYFIRNGQRFHHILDPHTGYPALLSQSVTILAPRTYWADALATGVFVLGAEEGLELVESLDGIEALIVDSDGEIHVSSGLSDRI